MLEDKMAASIFILTGISRRCRDVRAVSPAVVRQEQEKNSRASGYGFSVLVKRNLTEPFVLRHFPPKKNQRELIYRWKGLFPEAKENDIH